MFTSHTPHIIPSMLYTVHVHAYMYVKIILLVGGGETLATCVPTLPDETLLTYCTHTPRATVWLADSL